MKTLANHILWTVSAAALAAGIGSPASAQTSTDTAAAPDQNASPASTVAAANVVQDTTEGDIVVTGVRASLQGAQAIKRNSAQVVDSIVAEDIGKFPDNTVSDALQRVTGVQVSRGGGEAQTPLIRGLPNIQSYINGREVFTGTLRGVALQDIPAELVAGIDVYKTATPELVEGGVAGLIDIRLRRPFDLGDGLTVSGGGRALYGEQSDKWSYVGSGLASYTADIGDGGRIGMLLGASYNKRQYRDDTDFNFNFSPRANLTGGAAPGTVYRNPTTGNPLLFPQTAGVIYNVGDRERPALNGSLQYSPHDGAEFFLDGLFTGYREKFDSNFFIGLPGQAEAPLGAFTVVPGTDVIQTATNLFNFTINSKQAFVRRTDTYQIAGGTRWTLGDGTKLSTQLVYNKSIVKTKSVIIDLGYVVPQLDYDFSSGTSVFNLNGTDPASPVNPVLINLFDTRTLAKSRQYAWHVDLVKDLGGGFFREFKGGWRFTDRKGQSDGANPSGYGIPGVPASTLPADFLTLSPDNAVYGRSGIGRFLMPSSDYLLGQTDTLRRLANRPAGDPAFDPNSSFRLAEKTYAAYAQLGFETGGERPVDGVFGARLVNTDVRLAATSNINGVISPIDRKQNYIDVLPSLSLRWRLADTVQLRLVGGKSITRSEFDQLNPATALTQQSTTLQGTGSGGNAALQPIRSDNVDATAEWYFSRTGSLTVAAFYRKLNGYVQAFTAPETLPGINGVPSIFQVTRPRNTDGELKGADVAFTAFADFLPGALSGIGVQANFTYTDGTALNPFSGQDAPIAGLSKYSYNIVGIYEKYGLSTRLAYNWRGRSGGGFRAGDPLSIGSGQPSGGITVQPLGFLDLSINYAVNDSFTLTFDATNLTKTVYRDDYVDGVAPRDTRTYERTFGAGARFKF
ncbi:MAG TPA: TonB-dependent receptor [Sphingomonas sp.]|jgi:TonB-dependent receptor